MKDYLKCKGFTLAEVLITLAVIGIVAAMTIPNLVQNYQKKSTAVRIKKAYSMIYQAIKLSEVDNGNFNEWDMGLGPSIENTRKFVQTYIAPYIKGLQECSSGRLDYSCTTPVSHSGVNYLMNNGEGIAILSYAAGPGVVDIIYDLNPGKGDKSVMGKDYFYFQIKNGKLLPIGYISGMTREDIFNGKIQMNGGKLIYTCKKEPGEKQDGYEERYRHGCTALLYVDGWEFKDDYPW